MTLTVCTVDAVTLEVVHQPAVWRRKEPTTGGRAVALMKEGTEFDATGAQLGRNFTFLEFLEVSGKDARMSMSDISEVTLVIVIVITISLS